MSKYVYGGYTSKISIQYTKAVIHNLTKSKTSLQVFFLPVCKIFLKNFLTEWLWAAASECTSVGVTWRYKGFLFCINVNSKDIHNLPVISETKIRVGD